MQVLIGPAATKIGKWWVGVATGNRWSDKKRRSVEAALEDARRLEKKRELKRKVKI